MVVDTPTSAQKNDTSNSLQNTSFLTTHILNPNNGPRHSIPSLTPSGSGEGRTMDGPLLKLTTTPLLDVMHAKRASHNDDTSPISAIRALHDRFTSTTYTKPSSSLSSLTPLSTTMKRRMSNIKSTCTPHALRIVSSPTMLPKRELTPSTTASPMDALSARLTLNKLQNELQLRDLEVQKLAKSAAEARKERDVFQRKSESLETKLRMSTLFNGQNNQDCLKEEEKSLCVLPLLGKEADALHRQAEMAALELKGSRARLHAAEEHARLAEARSQADASALRSKNEELHAVTMKLHAVETQMKHLASDLALAQDRARLAEVALAEERQRSRSKDSSSSSTSALAEAALTAQVRALATQLKAVKMEAANARQELRNKQSAHDTDLVNEKSSLLSANKELEAALAKAGEELQKREAENASLRNALQDRDSHAASAGASNQQQYNVLQKELITAKARTAELEAALMTAGQHSTPTSISPLRDAVSSLRSELHDRELRLAAAEEELSLERHRSAELHRQVLDQAMELDELQREAHRGDEMIRTELENLKRENKALIDEIEALRMTVANRQTTLPGKGVGVCDNCSDNARVVEGLREENNRLCEEIDVKEAEIMALQGRLNLIQAVKREHYGNGEEVDEDNWLTG